jgi:pyruvate formate lyase activating enzyme
MGVDELLDAVQRDRIFYDESGGGVTFSGGEPMMQAGFLLAALEACWRAGIHTAVDTSGVCERSDLLAMARRTDLILFDVKIMDPEKHSRFTGASNDGLLANLRALADFHDQIWLRVPVVPGINDDEENMAATARLAASLPAVRRVHLLPYHRFGSHKHSRLGTRRSRNGLEPPADDRMRALAGHLAAAGVESRIGG